MSADGFVVDDGGRAAAGYRGHTGDCFTRAVAIAADLDYQHVYDLVIEAAKRERPGSKRRGGKRSHPRTGVFTVTARRVMDDLGWEWTPTMTIGAGTTMHLRADELPPGRLVVNLSKHFAAVIDGVVHDIYDPRRDGTRCVYGYWQSKETSS